MTERYKNYLLANQPKPQKPAMKYNYKPSDIFHLASKPQNMKNNNRFYYREEIEKKSKQIKPEGIRKFNKESRDIINISNNKKQSNPVFKTSQKRIYRKDDTYSRIFPGKNDLSYDNIRFLYMPDKYEKMNNDHVGMLFDRYGRSNLNMDDDRNKIVVNPNKVDINILKDSIKKRPKYDCVFFQEKDNC